MENELIQTHLTDENPVMRENKKEIVKPIPEFEAILLSILGREEYHVNNRIRLGTTKGTYMGDHGTYRKVQIFSLDSLNEYEITTFMNVFMHEISESTMMQIIESHPMASRYAYHNNRLVEVVHIKNNIRYEIRSFESDELKDQSFEETIIGLVCLLYGDTVFQKTELLEN